METRILAVDDDSEFLSAVKGILETAGYEVTTASNGSEALQLITADPPDLIVCDVAMPGINGYQLFKEVMQDDQLATLPFIFLSGRNLDSDIRYGKELGADDYLLKPVEGEDLLASVRGKLRRSRQRAEIAANPSPPAAPADPGSLRFGPLRLNLSQYQAWMNDEPVKLSSREFRLLAYLATHPHEIFSSQELVLVTHELDTTVRDSSSLLRPLVRSIRRKLGYNTGNMGCIKNIRGIGYRFVPPA
jgi:DNA-binding response OmpR family regulator